MQNFSHITAHPDYEEIVAKLVTGTSIKDVSNWLKVKHSEKKSLQISAKMLQEFMNAHMDLEAQLKRDILAKKNGGHITTADGQKISASLVNNKTYQERLVELAGQELDLKKSVKNLIIACQARMEQVFDKIQENPTINKNDYVLLKYFEVLFNALEKGNKIVNEAPDQIIQHNINIQAVEQHTAVFQEAIRETLASIDPESALLFIEIFTQKLNKLKNPADEIAPSIENRLKEAYILQEGISNKLEGVEGL